MSKIVDGTVCPADPGVDIDWIVKWLLDHGYVERGAFIGEDEKKAVFWLKPADEPGYLSEILGQPVVPATVRYPQDAGGALRGERRFATTLTVHEIWRRRRRNPHAVQDLAFVRLPTRAERERAYGLS